MTFQILTLRGRTANVRVDMHKFSRHFINLSHCRFCTDEEKILYWFFFVLYSRLSQYIHIRLGEIVPCTTTCQTKRIHSTESTSSFSKFTNFFYTIVKAHSSGLPHSNQDKIPHDFPVFSTFLCFFFEGGLKI